MMNLEGDNYLEYDPEKESFGVGQRVIRDLHPTGYQ